MPWMAWWRLAGDVLLGQNLAGLYLALAVAPNHKGMPHLVGRSAAVVSRAQVLSSRNIVPRPITDFVFGGLNYQIEHHLFPACRACTSGGRARS